MSNESPYDGKQNRVAVLRFQSHVTARQVAMVLDTLPKDAEYVRGGFSLDAAEHEMVFRSSFFKPVEFGERPGEILPKWVWQRSDDGDSRRIVGVEVEWPVAVDFPALERA